MGWVTVVRRGAIDLAIFAILYPLPILAFVGIQAPRYLIPWIPVFFAFSVCGVLELTRAFGKRATQAGLTLVGVALIVMYAGAYGHKDFGPIRDGPMSRTAQQTFGFIRAETPPASTLVFRRPRAMALFTQRSSSTYWQPADPNDLWNYMRDIHASYLVVGPEDYGYLPRFVTRFSNRLQLVFGNPDFQVYRLRPAAP